MPLSPTSLTLSEHSLLLLAATDCHSCCSHTQTRTQTLTEHSMWTVKRQWCPSADRQMFGWRLTTSGPMSQSAESARWTLRGSSTSRSGSHSVSRLWAPVAVGANGGPPWKSGKTPALTGPGDSWAQGPVLPSFPPLQSPVGHGSACFPSYFPFCNVPLALTDRCARYVMGVLSRITRCRGGWWSSGLIDDESLTSYDIARALEGNNWRVFPSQPIPVCQCLSAQQRAVAPAWGMRLGVVDRERGGRRRSRPASAQL